MMMLGFSDCYSLAAKIAAGLNVRFAEIHVHRFPDGESRVTLPAMLSERVIICRSLNDPNSKLVELLLAAKTARTLGAKHLTLIAPYLCYMRQDMAFNTGDAISQTIIGQWLAQQFDAVVTVEPHLHRVHRLSDAIPAQSAIALSAGNLMGQFIRDKKIDAILLGPDEESTQWVSEVAAVAKCAFGVCRKVRHNDYDTSIQLPAISMVGRHVVLVDDIVSSGGTLLSAAHACLKNGAKQIDALVVHALFSAEIGHKLADTGSGISSIWSTDSVVHPTNVISLAPLIISALGKD